jgi:hypothetical protein
LSSEEIEGMKMKEQMILIRNPDGENRIGRELLQMSCGTTEMRNG